MNCVRVIIVAPSELNLSVLGLDKLRGLEFKIFSPDLRLSLQDLGLRASDSAGFA